MANKELNRIELNCPLCDKQEIASALGQLSINFTCIFKVLQITLVTLPPPDKDSQILYLLHGKFQRNINMGTICLQASLRSIYLVLNITLTFSFSR